MLAKPKKMASKGFTIIEVMIVLAVAGLILLIVLLAVPALQRNARNTSIKNDASALTSAINEYVSNNNGTNPAAMCTNGSTVVVGETTCGTVPAGVSPSDAKISGSTVMNTTKLTTLPTVGGSTLTASNLYWDSGNTCSGTANPRGFTVWYAVETSGGTSNQCIDAN